VAPHVRLGENEAAAIGLFGKAIALGDDAKEHAFGDFAKHLGATKLDVKTFNAGPAAIEALKSGAIDASSELPANRLAP